MSTIKIGNKLPKKSPVLLTPITSALAAPFPSHSLLTNFNLMNATDNKLYM